jgi:DeoR/GlpR family transcriptional regulator of sugar metabolism
MSAPSGAMLGPERQRRLSQRLIERGSIRVGEEARSFGVSGETIRRDIKALVGAGIATPVFGGAVLRPGLLASAMQLPPVTEREVIEQRAKNAIGAAAARRIQSGQVVILDAGTTTLSVARHLGDHRNLTVVTNSLAIAQVTAGLPTCTTYVIGGKLVTGSLSMVGPQARRDLAGITADWAFLGAAAIGVGGDFASADPEEAEVKQSMIRAARAAAIVADHTKFAARGFVAFAAAREVQMLFTTPGAPAGRLRAMRKASVTVEICSEEEHAVA